MGSENFIDFKQSVVMKIAIQKNTVISIITYKRSENSK